VVYVRRSGRGRVNIAGVVCFRPSHRPHLFYKVHVYHGRKKEPKSFAWTDYRDLIVAVHRQLGTPLIWLWDNSNVHLVQELFDFAEENKQWLQIVQLPSYAPELNPQEGIWSLIRCRLADFAAADLAHLTRVVKRHLKRIQYRPGLIDGCLAQTGLIIEAQSS
jgi:transposase